MGIESQSDLTLQVTAPDEEPQYNSEQIFTAEMTGGPLMNTINQADDYAQHSIPMRFGEGFLRDYAPRLINNPEVAMVEIVSNSWDAGADRVDITWPDENGLPFSVADNGTGMTYDEFTYIWSELSYSRADKGRTVTFPPGNRQSVRKVFGKNGKGRLSLFCFDDEYVVETAKDGEKCRFRVTRQSIRGSSPFIITLEGREPTDVHGTTISCNATYNYIGTKRLIELIGSKFVADPALQLRVNQTPIELTDLDNVADKHTLPTPYGEVVVYMFDSRRRGRTSQQHGVAWWVNKKSVGKQGWRGPNGTSILDARTTEAMRYTFIVVADILEDHVEYDWTRFVEDKETETVLTIVNKYIQQRLDDLFFEKRNDRRKEAFKNNRERLRALPPSARSRVSSFVNDLQIQIPTLKQEHLNLAVGVFANLEEARTGYTLLEQLAAITPEDVDRLSDILSRWNIQDAQIVLEELERRLNLISKLDEVVDLDADELHVIHPLIEKGLWIFGPEYESIAFTSNKGLTNVIRKLIGDKEIPIVHPRRRPDFVILPDRRIGVFSRDSYGENAEVDGLAKVLVVELKRGGSEINIENTRQAEDYCDAIARSGNLTPDAKIICYVLGTRVGSTATKSTRGDNDKITVIPRTYRTVIQQAQARTFHLKRQIEEAKNISEDKEINDILLIKSSRA